MAHSKRARRAAAAAVLASAASLSLLLTAPTASACPALTGTIGNLITHGGCDVGCGPLDCPPARSARGGGGNNTTMGGADRGGAPFEIAAVDFTFLPNEPIIKPNTVVRWVNNSMFFPHTSTRTPTWDSGSFGPGESFERNFPAAEAGLSFDYLCTLHFGMEGFVNVTHFGDANLDGRVNLNDFNVLAANFGQTNRTWEQGDFNEDGTVNLNDFNLLAANFGREIQPASLTINIDFGAAVPEPVTTAGLLLLPVLARRARKTK